MKKTVIIIVLSLYSIWGFSQDNKEINDFIDNYANTFTMFAKNLDLNKLINMYSKDVKILRTEIFGEDIKYYDYENVSHIPSASGTSPYTYTEIKKAYMDLRDYYALNNGGLLYKVNKKSIKIKKYGNMAYCFFTGNFSATVSLYMNNLRCERVATLVLYKENNNWKIINENIIDLIGEQPTIEIMEQLNELDKLFDSNN